MEFNVWDIGPASMSTVNQCFFTDKALYVVVWNLALGEEAIANLQFWLLNIEVREFWCAEKLYVCMYQLTRSSMALIKLGYNRGWV